MYSRRVIDAVLLDRARRDHWEPVYHTVGEVEAQNAKFDLLLDRESNQSNTNIYFKESVRLTECDKAEIRAWVLNEQRLCFADADYFLTRYGYLEAHEEVLRWKPRIAQQIFHTIMANCEDANIAIQLFCLKARQVGLSTATALYFLHRLLFRNNSYAVMASVRHEQSDKLKAMLDACTRKLPFWLIPSVTTKKTKDKRWANGSILSIQSGSQKVGIAQGWSPTAVHISELADLKNPEKTIDEGLLPACHPYPSLFFVQEGTGADSDSWMAKKWDYYEANWGKGGRFKTIFIPPACAADLYPLPEWVAGNPIPQFWQPMIETEKMRQTATLYVRSTDYLTAALGAKWEMTREFMWFWECGYREAVSTHTEKTFIAQMASTPKEAMQGKFDRVFTDETIEVITKEREQEYQAYAITGKTILIGGDNRPYQPPLDSIDQSAPRIPISWTGNDDNNYYWELVPLKRFDDSIDQNCYDKLLVFQPPERGVTNKMGIGIDNAAGLGKPNEDRGYLAGVLNRSGVDRDTQICAFSSVSVNSAQMARIAACVAAWYIPFIDDPRGPKFTIEQVKGPGDDCQNQLKIMGFLWHHGMIFYDRAGLPDPTKATKEGWYTSRWSRSMMLDKYINAVNDGWLKLNCPVAIREAKALIRTGSGGDAIIDHPADGHSDASFANGMAYFTAHDLENTAARYQARYKSLEQEAVELDLRWASLGVPVDAENEWANWEQ
jgi:hypothetical protein